MTSIYHFLNYLRNYTNHNHTSTGVERGLITQNYEITSSSPSAKSQLCFSTNRLCKKPPYPIENEGWRKIEHLSLITRVSISTPGRIGLQELGNGIWT
jgi:hypothetical protein